MVLGATGGTGRELVVLARERGHDVTAFVRAPKKLAAIGDGIRVVEGDPHDVAALARAMAGHDVVVSALGPPGLGKSSLLEDCARATITAMHGSGVKRLAIVSAAVLFENEGPVVWLARRTFLRNVATGSRAMEDVVRASGVDYLVVRPPRLTHGARTGRYRVAVGRLPPGPRVVSRADVAHYLVEELERPRFESRLVGMAGLPRWSTASEPLDLDARGGSSTRRA